MQKNYPHLFSDEQIDAWLHEDARNTFDLLQHWYNQGRFTGQYALAVSARLARENGRIKGLSQEERNDLDRRSVAAAELSAKSAVTAARWAWASAVISLAALVISALPYIREWI